jgi:phosphate transport system permease protein
MVLPFITSISRDVFEDRAAGAEGSGLRARLHHLGSGAQRRAALTRVGVIGGVMLALGRALGETMAVTFVIGNAHRISARSSRPAPRSRPPSPTNSPKRSAISTPRR